MFFLFEPSDARISRFIAAQRSLPFSYDEVGATNRTPPSNYTVDHNRIQLGVGAAVYQTAVEGLRRWKQFDLGWLSIVPSTAAIEEDVTVVVKAKSFGIWSLSAARIVYVIDETNGVERFGFAYGTLPGHVETGEERFTIEWDQTDDSVWYDILAFSRPNHPLVRLAAPFARRLQKQFASESMQRMKRLVLCT